MSRTLPNRREFLCTVGGCAAAAAAAGCSDLTHTSWFRSRFREMPEAEKKTIIAALGRVDGNIVKAAELLGVSRPTLYDLMHRLGLK